MPSAGEGGSAPAVQRLFLALWPDDAVRARLVEVRDYVAAHHRGRPVAAANLHITLAFLGSVDADRQRCAETAAAGITTPAFTLTLDTLGHWPRPQVSWVGSDVTPDAMNELQAYLRRALGECGFELDNRPFRPHVTLLRKAGGRPGFAPALEAPIQWPVTRVHLVASVTRAQGAEYRIVGTWPLAK